MKKPTVSVIMPVFNGEKYLRPAVKSILAQTFKDFEFIIIDDGSTDDSVKIIRQFRDKRIKIVSNRKNLGVAKSLNIGLKLSRGQYIARLDSDDICEKERFKKQIAFLSKNPETVVVGSRIKLIDENGKKISESKIRKDYANLPITDQEIRRVLFKRNPISHPSTMIRKSALDQVDGYRNFFNGAEDYDLWFRLSKVGKLHNLNEKLTKRRWQKNAVTRKNHFKIELLALAVRLRHYFDLNFFKQSSDILVGLFTFLSYKFWLIVLLFRDRLVPPEPDDVYLYLMAAKNLLNIQSFEQYRMLLFSIWLQFLSFITRSNLEKTFEINFYLGTIFLFFVLIYFLRQVEQSILNRIILITMLGLYTGSGAYHGFYWVMPSFYMTGLLFLLLGIVFSNKKINYFLLFLIVLFYIFVHPSSILFLILFPLLGGLYSVIGPKEKSIIFRSFCIFGMGILGYFMYGLIGSFFPNLGSLNAPSDTVAIITNIFQGKITFLSTPIIWHEYFKFIFLNWVTMLAFAACLLLGAWIKQFKILAIYLSGLIIVGISAINPFGYRSLEFLWPVTFLVLGIGLIGVKELLGKINQKAAITLCLLLLAIFGFMANLLNVVWIKSQNTKDNYSWNRMCPLDLNLTSLPLLFDSWESYNAFLLNGLEKNAHVITPEDKINSGSLLVEKDRSQLKIYHPTGFEELLVSKITRTEPFPQYQIANYYWTNIGSDEIKKFDKKEIFDCGYFKIYYLSLK